MAGLLSARVLYPFGYKSRDVATFAYLSSVMVSPYLALDVDNCIIPHLEVGLKDCSCRHCPKNVSSSVRSEMSNIKFSMRKAIAIPSILHK